MLAISSYIIFTVALQLLVYNIQFFTDIFTGAPLNSLMFLAGFISSISATLWKNLKIAPLFISPVILLVFEISELLFFHTFGGPELISREIKTSLFIDLLDTTQIPLSITVQFFVSAIVAVGIWINEKHEKFSFRRGATDLDEVGQIFEWKEKIMPHEGDNLFKYQRLLKRSFTLVGVIKNEIVSAVHAVRIDDTLFYFDLFVIPGWREKVPDTGRWMVEALLKRPELNDAGIKQICAVVHGGAEFSLEYYLSCGFKEISKEDPLLADFRSKADRILSDIYPGWNPLSNAANYLQYLQE